MVKKIRTEEEKEKLPYGDASPEEIERVYAVHARIGIQVEMKRRDLGYRELTEMFNERFNQKENERNMRNKIARGTFSAAFFLMCMEVLGRSPFDSKVEDIDLIMQPLKGE